MAAKKGVKVVGKTQPGKPTHGMVMRYVIKENGAMGLHRSMERLGG